MRFENRKPLYINSAEVYNTRQRLGFAELTTDEQIAKKIFEATGDKTFKGFLPLSWNTKQIVKMRYYRDKLKAGNKLSIFNMQVSVPEVSANAHDYFLKYGDKIRGFIPDNLELPKIPNLTIIIVVAGLAAAAVLFTQVKPYLPKAKAE